MKQSDQDPKRARSSSTRIGGALGLLLALALLLAAPASASYEQVGTFGDNKTFGETRGMAVNISGAGGVPPGTLWVSRRSSSTLPFFGPKGEFLGESAPFGSGSGVAVDQATGNVYVLTDASKSEDVVKVYSADGSELIASFGERGTSKETVDESPGKIHDPQRSGIAVDDSGVVYVSDIAEGGRRVMVFEPQSPGDYEHYLYSGRANDIAASKLGDPIEYWPEALALDSADNLYIASEGNAIYEFAPGEPAAHVCEYKRPSGGIMGMTANPASGEVFYFTYKDKKIHQLSACNSQGELVETNAFTPIPKTEEIWALAFNPTLAWEAPRPPGILYAADSQSEPAHADVFAPAEVLLPVVESQSVSSVTSTTASLSAQINPKGSVTRYTFQYITETAYQANEPADRFASASEAPLGGAVLGSGQAPLHAGVALVGLQPDTEYRYRVIASSHCDPEKEEELCEDVGPAQAFRTFLLEAPGLPDNRAWELVSPAQKHSGEVIPAQPQIGSCPIECKPAALTGAKGYPMQSAPDGDAVVYEGFPFSTTEGAAIFNQYISRHTASGWQTTLLSPPLHSSSSAYKAFDAELTQGLLSQDTPTLTPDAPPGYNNLYTQPTTNPAALTPLLKAEPPNRNPKLTYAGAAADFSRLFFEADDALTGETSFAPEAVDGGKEKNNLYESVNGQLQLVNVLPGNVETAPGAAFGSRPKGAYLNANLSHAISDDGSRAFWSDESGQVYAREDGESTTEIPDPGKFLSASADGSKVLLDNGHIYDLASEAITDLSEGEGGFQGIVGQSEDLSRIYFVDTAVLTGEEKNDHGAKAQGGKYNLYAWNEGVSAFVATLLPEDNPGSVSQRGDWLPSPSQRSAEASPGGRWVAFLSAAPLTGYDNVGACGSQVGSEGGLAKRLPAPCPEVFLYDSASGKLSCPSCNSSGTRPLGESVLRLIYTAKGSLPQPHYLLDSGRLYFDSRDSLSPYDTNGGVEDVYQYEPQGIGSCKREGGCVSLISAGREPVDSNFLAVDTTAKNVFFTSRDRLVSQDSDDAIDLYVAREGGGIPEEIETECQGEACQPAAIAPNGPTPAFKGPGNLTQRLNGRCAKGKIRKRGRCVRKRSHKRPHGRTAKRNRGGAR